MNICIGLAQNYSPDVFCNLPEGFTYILLNEYTPELLSNLPIDHLITPVCTYALLKYEVEYLDYTKAKTVLRKKLRELSKWIDEATDNSWFSVCNLAGLL